MLLLKCIKLPTPSRRARRSPCCFNADSLSLYINAPTMEGVKVSPSAFGMHTGAPFWILAIAEFVVPRSMPTTSSEGEGAPPGPAAAAGAWSLDRRFKCAAHGAAEGVLRNGTVAPLFRVVLLAAPDQHGDAWGTMRRSIGLPPHVCSTLRLYACFHAAVGHAQLGCWACCPRCTAVVRSQWCFYC